MPADHGFRIHKATGILPLGPHVGEQNPEDAIPARKTKGFSMFTSEDGPLLAGCDCFQNEITNTVGILSKAWKRPENGEAEKPDHGSRMTRALRIRLVLVDQHMIEPERRTQDATAHRWLLSVDDGSRSFRGVAREGFESSALG